jgi:dipeptidase E
VRLYLSSQGFGNHVERLHDMVGNEKRVLFIDNAKDFSSSQERAAHVAEKKTEFEAAGFGFYELDLRNYFRSPDTLRPIIEAAKFVFVSGGNTFVLRRAFAYSGLDSILLNCLRANTLTYAGSSAGSIIMTNTLKGTELGDDPYAVPDGYKSEAIWDGLGLVYPQIVPHYESESWMEKSNAMAKYFKNNQMEYVTLRDGEVYVVDGKYEEKLT